MPPMPALNVYGRVICILEGSTKIFADSLEVAHGIPSLPT